MQQRNIIWISLILLFLLETTIFHWIIPLSWHENIHISPHIVLVVILFVALYVNRHFALILGLVFGLLQDIVFYGHMIGPHAFGMGLMGYVIGYLFRRVHANFFVAIPIIISGVFSYHLIIYSLYHLFNITKVTMSWIFLHQILPSLLFNLLFALVVYIPIRYLTEKMDKHKEESESE